MVQYVQADVLGNLCSEPIEPNLGTLLVEVVASVLDNEVRPSIYYWIKVGHTQKEKKCIQCLEMDQKKNE